MASLNGIARMKARHIAFVAGKVARHVGVAQIKTGRDAPWHVSYRCVAKQRRRAMARLYKVDDYWKHLSACFDFSKKAYVIPTKEGI